jgi:hypothetical protein
MPRREIERAAVAHHHAVALPVEPQRAPEAPGDPRRSLDGAVVPPAGRVPDRRAARLAEAPGPDESASQSGTGWRRRPAGRYAAELVRAGVRRAPPAEPLDIRDRGVGGVARVDRR